MEKEIKRKIDNLLELEKSIKNMYSKLALRECDNGELSDEDLKEIQNIEDLIPTVLEIEEKRFQEIDPERLNVDAINAYLIKYYDDISEFDFYFLDNNTERARLFNKLRVLLIKLALQLHIDLDDKNMHEAIDNAMIFNSIRIIQEFINKIDDKDALDAFVMLKYGYIYLSTYYDEYFFKSKEIHPLVHYSYFKDLMPDATNDEIKNCALNIIHSKFLNIIDTLYSCCDDEQLEDEETEIYSLFLLFELAGAVLSTLDPKYIDERYVEFRKIQKDEEKYSDVNSMIVSVLNKSKGLILETNKADNN